MTWNGSTLSKVIACCLMSPNHYLSLCWLIINKVQLHSPEGQLSVSKISMKSTCLKFLSNLTGTNELNDCISLLWRHNGLEGVSNHQPHECLLNRSFMRRSKKTSKLRVTGFCAGNSPETGEFPAQMASNAENVSIWWRHHVEQSSYTNSLIASETMKKL